MMQEFTIYGGLFLNALGAGSILPVQSEALLSLFLVKQQGYAWLLVFFATLGNTAGAIINWWLGKKIETFKNRKWFPASPEKLEQASVYYNKFAKWCLFFSWVPVIGDALTVMAINIEEVKNPIHVALELMKVDDRVLGGSGATNFARQHGFEKFSTEIP